MKIAFFCDSYIPTRNGVAISASSTARLLREMGHEVVIFAPRYRGYEDRDPNVVRFPASPYYRVRDFPVTWPVLPYISWPGFVRFKQENFDVVHTHSPFILGTVGAHWAQHFEIPVVFTFHTLYHRYIHYSPFPETVSRPYTLRKVRKYCTYCDHIIAPSHAIERLVHRFNPHVPTDVIPTGVELARFRNGDREGARKLFGMDANAKVLLYVGRLAPEKNLDFMLSSLEPVLKADPQLRLLLVGGGPLLDALKVLCQELGIENQVIFSGFVDPAKLKDVYAAGDAFVFASRTETQGVCITEAMAAGLPCVVVGAMGAAEALEDGIEGFIVPPHQSRFAAAVRQLMDNDNLRAQMAKAAAARSEEYSLQSSASRIFNVYRSVRRF
jgi:glycosyltransferase involved in cell wall biosynthesis